MSVPTSAATDVCKNIFFAHSCAVQLLTEVCVVSALPTLQVYSNDGANGTKYIQDVFKAEPGLSAAEKSGVGVVLCGHKEMCNAVKEIVAAQGVDADKVLLNF